MGRPQLLSCDDGNYRIQTNVRSEGRGPDREGNFLFALPHRAHRGLFPDETSSGWLEVELDSGERFIGMARRQPTAVLMGIPKRCATGISSGDVIEMTVRDPTSRRAIPGEILSPDGIDWAALVPEDRAFAEGVGLDLVLHSSYEEPFSMRRRTPYTDVMWLLGFYYAEGSKSERGTDWNLGNRNVACLEETIRQLGILGIPVERMYLEVIHPRKEAPEIAVAKYAELGVEITAVRIRKTERGDDAGVLHVRRSLNLKRMLCSMYQHLEDHGFEKVTVEGCRAFANGFLEGDGQITIMPAGVHLRFVGADPTQSTCALSALNRGMGWELEWKLMKKNASGNGDEQRWSVDAIHIAELIEAGIFKRVSSWPRILAGLEQQTMSFRRLWDTCHELVEFSFREAMTASGMGHGPIAAMRLHGYLSGERDTLIFTKKGEMLAEALTRLK